MDHSSFLLSSINPSKQVSHSIGAKVYEEILAQSEYGYVAKTGKWKRPTTRKGDIEEIQRKSLQLSNSFGSTINKNRRVMAKS